MENANVIEAPAIHPATQMNLATVLKIPAVRQVTLLIGVAAAVAMGFAIVQWSQSPAYTQLYAGMSAAEAAEVADALRASDIAFKIDTAAGSVMVAEGRLHDARLQLASQGLPQSAAAGMAAMNEQSSFGVSQFMENARYQHAKEAELAKTIASMGAVQSARVHLALPKQSAFIRNQRGASASVMLQLFRGRALESDQASAITHLVASSVQNLSTRDVTVIDQYGRLLSSGDQQATDALAATQLKYTRKVEQTYKQRIEEILTAFVGAGRVRAQVTADLDFTVSEETRESFDPARAVVRSEQTSEELRRGSDRGAAGVPGALSNQPPEAVGDAAVPEEAESVEAQNESRMATRNYEVDRTISHTRPQTGAIRRLSVAVLVDDRPYTEAGTEGDAAAQTALTDQDIERITTLVREAVGFDAARGDTVTVMRETFRDIGPIEEVEAAPIWKNPAVRDIGRQALGAILVLAIAFGVVRPMLRGVLAGGGAASGQYIAAGGAAPAFAGPAALDAGGAGAPAITGPNYEEKVAAAKNMTGHDPARVAQVVKKWVTVDD